MTMLLYRDVEAYYLTDIEVRWFLGEYNPKSENHRRAKKLRGKSRKYSRNTQRNLRKN
jgi:hypothetical protein